MLPSPSLHYLLSFLLNFLFFSGSFQSVLRNIFKTTFLTPSSPPVLISLFFPLPSNELSTLNPFIHMDPLQLGKFSILHELDSSGAFSTINYSFLMSFFPCCLSFSRFSFYFSVDWVSFAGYNWILNVRVFQRFTQCFLLLWLYTLFL